MFLHHLQFLPDPGRAKYEDPQSSTRGGWWSRTEKTQPSSPKEPAGVVQCQEAVLLCYVLAFSWWIPHFPRQNVLGICAVNHYKKKSLKKAAIGKQYPRIPIPKAGNPLNPVLGKQITNGNLKRQEVNIQRGTAFPGIGKKR